MFIKKYSCKDCGFEMEGCKLSDISMLSSSCESCTMYITSLKEDTIFNKALQFFKKYL